MIATLRHRTGEEIQDRYRIEGELGAGAFGTVYRCRDKELNLLVAVKELHVLDDPSTAGHERSLALEQFRAEAIHLSQLRHPHIVSGHYQPHAGTWLICPVCGLDFRGTASCPEHGAAPVVLKQRHYLVMEYVAGPDLEMAARNAGGRLPVEVAVKAARQVVDALVHIHERGWVHRDIKPENIRLRGTDIEKSAAVLLDFGIATLSGAGGEFSTRPQKKTQGGGTWGYAPDDPRERLHPDARSDIHALGMTLYSVLCGRDPTEAGPLIEMRRSRPRLFNPEIPPILDELLVACIAFNPAQRPASARDVAQALAALDAPPPAIDLAPPSTSSTSPPPASTSPVANVALTVPFGFVSGETATNLTQLVRLCDKFPDEACDYLFHGDVAAWLRANGRPDEANRVDQIRSEYATQKRQGLEAFIQYTGILPPPTLSVEPESLDFGTLWLGQKREIDLLVHNPGRGHLFGLVRSRYSNLTFPESFDGNANVLPVVLDSRGLNRGQYEGDLEIDSSGGEIRLPFRFTLHRRRSALPFWHVLSSSLAGALAGMLARTLPFFAHQPEVLRHWLSPGAEFGRLEDKAIMSGLFAFCAWAALAGLFAFEGVRRKSCSLFLSGAASSGLLGLACFAGATMILPAVDSGLRTVMQPVVYNWPAGAWMMTGGLAGAIYATASRWKDLTTTRALQVVAGWVVAIVILYALLAMVLLSMHSESVA